MPPPNHRTCSFSSKYRIFMCIIGTCGLLGCKTMDTPVAKKLSSSTPNDFLMGSGSLPCTAEKFTPPFSIISPCCMIRVRPPPPPSRSQSSSTRSEEHTSELQSRENLVCRLLLEKKNSHQHFQHRTKG